MVLELNGKHYFAHRAYKREAKCPYCGMINGFYVSDNSVGSFSRLDPETVCEHYQGYNCPEYDYLEKGEEGFSVWFLGEGNKRSRRIYLKPVTGEE